MIIKSFEIVGSVLFIVVTAFIVLSRSLPYAHLIIEALKDIFDEIKDYFRKAKLVCDKHSCFICEKVGNYYRVFMIIRNEGLIDAQNVHAVLTLNHGDTLQPLSVERCPAANVCTRIYPIQHPESSYVFLPLCNLLDKTNNKYVKGELLLWDNGNEQINIPSGSYGRLLLFDVKQVLNRANDFVISFFSASGAKSKLSLDGLGPYLVCLRLGPEGLRKIVAEIMVSDNKGNRLKRKLEITPNLLTNICQRNQ